MSSMLCSAPNNDEEAILQVTRVMFVNTNEQLVHSYSEASYED